MEPLDFEMFLATQIAREIFPDKVLYQDVFDVELEFDDSSRMVCLEVNGDRLDVMYANVDGIKWHIFSLYDPDLIRKVRFIVE